MKKIISKKIEMSAIFAFAFIMLFFSVSFVLAEDFSSEDSSPSSSSGKIEYKKILEKQERFDSAKRVLDQKRREEMERNSLKMKEIKSHLENELGENEARFGSSTVRIGDPTSSTTQFRKMEMESMIKERMKEEGEMRNGKEIKDRFDGRLDGRWAEFGTSTSSTTPFRKMELERMKKESVKIAERFIDNLKRLEDFYKRISEKVSKFENKAISVDESKSLLGIARLKINLAKSDVGNLVRIMKEGVGNQNRNDYFVLTKNLSIKAKDSIYEAQKALSDVVGSLKPGLNKNKSSSSFSSAISSASSSTASSATSSSSSSL